MVARQWRKRAWNTLYVWRKLLPQLKPFKAKLSLALVLTLVVVAAELLKPWPLKVVVDQAMVDDLLGETGDDEDLIRYDL